eukprot:jgi/Botrbrau1/8286/Bobra.0251s0015.1
MGVKMGGENQHSETTVRRIAKEVRDMIKKPEEGIRVFVPDDTYTEIQAEYQGPAGTPFEGGEFRLKLTFDADYPNSAPKGKFLTRIFHPNISTAGDVCVNVLKKDWKPDLGLRHVLLVIRCLLIEPFPESALNEEAGLLLLESYESYFKHAQLMTSIYAQPKTCVVRPSVLTAAGGANTVNGAVPAESLPTASADTFAPPVKKPKGIEKGKPGVIHRKKSLKRL